MTRVQITNSTRLTGSCNCVVFEKFTRAYWHQIALEIILLPILSFTVFSFEFSCYLGILEIIQWPVQCGFFRGGVVFIACIPFFRLPRTTFKRSSRAKLRKERKVCHIFLSNKFSQLFLMFNGVHARRISYLVILIWKSSVSCVLNFVSNLLCGNGRGGV